MSKEELQDKIITDLKNDFPTINITKNEDNITIKADDNTLWKIFEILYNGLDNVEFNMGQDEESYIIIKI